MTHVPPRETLSSLPAYAAGRPPAPIPGLTPYKLSSNENPWGPVPAALEAIAASTGTIHRYPDPSATVMREALSEQLGVDADHIVPGAGSLGALTNILATYAGTASTGAQDEVVYPWRSFEAYPIVIGTAGARSVQVPNRADGSHDLEAMLAAVTDSTRVIILCSPNNPTGPSLTQEQVDAFLQQVPQEVLVVIDEAYREFQEDPQVVDGIATYRQHPNVVVLRTFSKAHGLAGLRVGYSISQPEIADNLRRTAVTFAVTQPAQEAAVATLANMDQVMERVERITSERKRVQEELERMGCWVPATQANFVWLDLGDSARRFADACAEQAISVRAFDGEGVRVSIGEPEANDRFLDVCRQFSDLPQAPVSQGDQS